METPPDISYDACLAMLGVEKDSEEGVQLLRSFLADQKQQLDMKTAMLMRKHNSQLNFVPIYAYVYIWYGNGDHPPSYC